MSQVACQREIARVAGVSVSAVSLALRNHRKVSPKVRRKIQTIARKLGYKADPKVSQLMEHLRRTRTRRTGSKIAAIIPELSPEQLQRYFPIRRMLVGAREQAAEAGFDLEVFHLNMPGMTPKRLRSILLARGIQGIFVAPCASGVGRLTFDFTGFSAATAGYSIIDPLLHRSCPNYLQMMDETLAWMSRQGFRRVGFILTYKPGGIGHKLFSSSFLYYQNFLPQGDRIPILPHTELSDESILTWVKNHRPDAIISSGAIFEILKRLRVPIPRQIKFANIDLSEPPIEAAGVDHRYELVGRESIKLIISQIMFNLSGVPKEPKVVLVDSHWRAGFTLPGNPSRSETRTVQRQD